MSEDLWRDLSAAATDAGLGISVAAAVFSAAAFAVSHTFGAPLVRRTVWQVAIVAALGYGALELSGIGASLVAAVRGAFATIDGTSHRASGQREEWASEAVSELATPSSTSDEWRRDESTLDQPAPADSWSAVPTPGEATLPGAIVPGLPRGDIDVRPSEMATPATIVLGVVWVFGAGVLLVRKLLQSWGMSALGRRLPPYVDGVSEPAREICELSALFRYRRMVRLVTLPAESSPIAFGAVRPTIGLPADFARRFTDEERRAVLAHELAHLAAGDPLWRVLSDVLVAMLWWHPGAWLTRRGLIAESEAVADEASRAIPGGAENLASALLVLGKRLARRRAVAAYAADGEFRSSLGRRVERLLAECEQPWRPISNGKLVVARAVCGAAAIVLLLSVCHAKPSHFSSTQGESHMRTFSYTWRQSLCGVALAMFAGGSAVADAPPAEGPVAGAGLFAIQQDDEEKREEPRREREEERGEDGDREGEGERRADPPRRERAEGDRPEGEREGGERSEARRREAREIEARVERIRNRLRELGDRNPDESRALSQQAERLANRLRELRGEGERREGERPDRERPGREGSDRERGEGDRPRGDRPEREGDQPRRPRPEQVERARHLRAAIEHLRAAGMPDLAERLAREHEELMRSLRDLPEGGRQGGERREGDRRDPPPRERPGRPDRPDGPPHEGDRPRPDRPDRPDGPPRDGERPRPERPDRPEGDRVPEGDRRPDAKHGEEAQREAAELRRALATQHAAGDMLRLKLEAVAKALAERTERAQVEEAARQAALKQLEAARAAEQAKLAELAERRAAELALVQAELQAQMAQLKAEVEKLRDELAAKEAELTKTRELIEQRAK